jgi:CheY-like chemotaxis protein
MADDDHDDCQMARDALAANRLANELQCVHDGEELLDYLRRQGRYVDPVKSPRPGIIFLDLNMPKKSGREALEEIKADASLRSIPIVILTTSVAEVDIVRSYELGASGYISKPVTFEGLVSVMRNLGSYWFEVVELPQQEVVCP